MGSLFAHAIVIICIHMLLEKQTQTSTILSITKCYSIIYNIKQLTKKSADSSMVHLIKTCYLIGVLWGHRTLIHLGNPSFNREGVEMVGWCFPHFPSAVCETKFSERQWATCQLLDINLEMFFAGNSQSRPRII